MTLLATKDVVGNATVRQGDDARQEPPHEDPSVLQRLAQLLASSYSKMPLFS
jgi:hypothetical protein